MRRCDLPQNNKYTQNASLGNTTAPGVLNSLYWNAFQFSYKMIAVHKPASHPAICHMNPSVLKFPTTYNFKTLSINSQRIYFTPPRRWHPLHPSQLARDDWQIWVVWWRFTTKSSKSQSRKRSTGSWDSAVSQNIDGLTYHLFYLMSCSVLFVHLLPISTERAIAAGNETLETRSLPQWMGLHVCRLLCNPNILGQGKNHLQRLDQLCRHPPRDHFSR